MRTALILLLVVAAVLFLSNPSKAEFQEFMKDRSAEMIESKTGNNVVGRTLGRLGGDMLGGNISKVTRRDNYYLFSKYTIDLDGAERNEQQWVFVGILKNFIPIQKPAGIN